MKSLISCFLLMQDFINPEVEVLGIELEELVKEIFELGERTGGLGHRQ